jgi:hypothetical protein
MLSTSPSSRGELLIQQGELAGRRYQFEAIVCQNPTCQCDHVTLKCFAEMPEASLRAPIVVCLEMDLERQEITNLPLLGRKASTFKVGDIRPLVFFPFVLNSTVQTTYGRARPKVLFVVLR